MFLSVDMAILTPWSSQVHPAAHPEGAKYTLRRTLKEPSTHWGAAT